MTRRVPAPPADLTSVHAWIDRAGAHLRQSAPDLAGVVADYVGEAHFGASALAADLAIAGPGARLLEVGAGAALLSAGLQSNGFRVTALEPLGDGFSHMARLRSLVLEHAETTGARPETLDIPAEALVRPGAFDLAFSINVMEHVADPAAVLRQVLASLRPGGRYRFVCPNYPFPFEPHFNIPTLGSKARTWRVFQRRILASPVVVDPEGTWASLNWITVGSVRRACAALGVHPTFDRGLTRTFLQRALDDPSFQRRHGAVVRGIAIAIGALGLDRAALLLPPALQPAMSCCIERPV